jgi:isoquinoline 1-oxidoreductase subunit beta
MSSNPILADVRPSRRAFLKASVTTSGGMLLAISLPGAMRPAQAAGDGKWVGIWARIDPDETVTILCPTSEMGQGNLSALPQIFAEELRVEWSQVRAEHAPEGTQWGGRLTGGSASVRTRYTTLRRAGAAARDMLIRAAAATWAVPVSECQSGIGRVTHASLGTLTYGQLAAVAATLAPNTSTAYLDSLLTPDAEHRLIGRSLPRVDVPSKTNGTALFGLDVRLPNMVYAAVRHCPSLGGTLKSLPATPAGAIAVVPLRRWLNNTPAGLGTEVNAVAVVAGDTWTAMKLAKALKVAWTIPASAADVNTTKIMETAKALMANGTAVVTENKQNMQATADLSVADTALAQAARRYEFTYDVPYLAHSTFEPLNCTAQVTPTNVHIWAPTQSVSACELAAVNVTGIARAAVKVTNALMGGGLGRKFESDFVAQAIQVANHTAILGRPVKLTWSREEDFGNDEYRPMALARVQVGVNAAGVIQGWISRNVSPSIGWQRLRVTDPGTGNWQGTVGYIDGQAVEGARNLHYNFGAQRTDWIRHPSPVRVGFWRSVGAGINGFITESAIDEVANREGHDPYLYRRALLHDSPRAQRVLDEAARLAGWGRAMAPGRALGISLVEAFASIVCEVAEISVPAPGTIKVHHVWAAVDCGKAVNPENIKYQIEGAMVYGLTAALWNKITWVNGGTVEKNFNKSRKLLMHEMPKCDVSVLETPGVALGGIGEPGTPPIAAAVANAYFKLTGIRIRSLPFFPNAGGNIDA